MAALLYQTKLEYGSPTGSVSFRVDRFQTDSYSVRAAVGINNAEEKYNLTWAGLTLAELTALINSFKALKGVSTVDYQPPGAAASQKFTVAKYSIKEYPGKVARYSVDAELTREY